MYGITQTVAPAETPISLAEAKAHLRVDTSDEDALITTLIEAATVMAQTYTRRQFVSATYAQTFDAFPASGVIELGRHPLVRVTSITYTDADGNTDQTWSSAKYTVVSAPLVGYVVPAYDEEFPATREVPNAVTVTYVAGYGAASAVPDAIKAAIKLIVGDLFEHREARTEARLEDNPAVQHLLDTVRVMGVH